MSPKIQVLCIFYAMCLYFHAANGIQCYECSNLVDKNCGKIWGYEKSDTSQLVQCNSTATACRKITMENRKLGDVVTRECWESHSMDKSYIPKGCQDLKAMETCYCHNDEGCNGQRSLTSLPAFVAAVFVISVYELFAK